jgi:hypothetical protein
MKRARRSELFYFALEEGSSQAVSQLLFLPAGSLFLLGFPLCSFLLCRLFLRLTLGYFLLRFAFRRFLLGLSFGDLLLRFLLSLLLGYFFLRLFLGDFFLCYAAFLRRCSFLCSYFPLLRDFSLRSFFTSLLFGSHAFLRVGYPELSIYNKKKKTSE